MAIDYDLGLLPIRAFIVLLLSVTVSASSFLPEPYVKWTYSLPVSGEVGSRGLRKNNAVAVSKYGALLFATADDGSLHIIVPELGTGEVYEPKELPGTFTECRSGVAIFETEDELFAVYAVVDIPITADENDTLTDIKR